MIKALIYTMGNVENNAVEHPKETNTTNENGRENQHSNVMKSSRENKDEENKQKRDIEKSTDISSDQDARGNECQEERIMCDFYEKIFPQSKIPVTERDIQNVQIVKLSKNLKLYSWNNDDDHFYIGHYYPLYAGANAYEYSLKRDITLYDFRRYGIWLHTNQYDYGPTIDNMMKYLTEKDKMRTDGFLYCDGGERASEVRLIKPDLIVQGIKFIKYTKDDQVKVKQAQTANNSEDYPYELSDNNIINVNLL